MMERGRLGERHILLKKDPDKVMQWQNICSAGKYCCKSNSILSDSVLSIEQWVPGHPQDQVRPAY